MFKELYPLAKDAPIAMMITAEGDNLRVMVQQKDDSDTPLSIAVLATPEELDAELPAAIKQAVGTPESKTSVADQVAKQLAQTAANVRKPAKKKAATKPPAPTKSAATARPVAKGKPAATKPAVEAKPNKDDCLDDLATMQAKHGDKLKRDLFMKESATGRRFENLFGNWGKFLEAGKRRAAKLAKASPPPGAPAATGGDPNSLPLPLDANTGSTEQAAPSAPCYSEANAGDPSNKTDGSTALTDPAPVQNAQEDHGRGEEAPRVPAQPEDAAGTETLKIDGTSDPSETQSTPAAELIAAEDPPAANNADLPAERVGRKVTTMGGVIIAAHCTVEPTVGTVYDVVENSSGKLIKVRVRTFNDHSIFVDPIPETPPPLMRKIIDEEGNNLGEYGGTGGPGAAIRVNGKEYIIETATPKFVMVAWPKALEVA